jgi:hypothetical protein
LETNFSGKLISATGHTHDGGQEVTVYKNGSLVCKSAQIYGRKPDFVGDMEMPGMPGMKIVHISDTGSCGDFGEIKVGDSLVVGTCYDTSAHPLNKNMNGRGNAPIMGTSQVCHLPSVIFLSAYLHILQVYICRVMHLGFCSLVRK